MQENVPPLEYLYLGGRDCDCENENKKCLIKKAWYYLELVSCDYLTADPFTAKHGKHWLTWEGTGAGSQIGLRRTCKWPWWEWPMIGVCRRRIRPSARNIGADGNPRLASAVSSISGRHSSPTIFRYITQTPFFKVQVIVEIDKKQVLTRFNYYSREKLKSLYLPPVQLLSHSFLVLS